MIKTLKPGLRLLGVALVLSTYGLGLSAEAYAETQAPQGQNPSSLAQPTVSGAGSGLEEIIVTAEKRSTDLQKTPLALTALSGEALQREQVRGLEDLNGLVPSLKINDTTGYPQISIRGISDNTFTPLGESTVAVNLNEVYVSRPVAAMTGVYDVGDLEVLRGPQGTLYGRNATAGAINLTTARPTNQFSGYENVTLGNYGETRIEAAVGGPLVDDTVLVRVAGFRETRGGYGINVTTGNPIDDKDAYGVRATLVVMPTNSLKDTLIGEYYDEHDNGGANHFFGVPSAFSEPAPFQLLGGVLPSNPRDIANQFDPKFKLYTTAVTNILDWSADQFGVKSITGYREQNSFNRANLDGGDPGAYFISGEPAHQISEELQGHFDNSFLHLTAGLYYFNEDDAFNPASIITNNEVLNAAGFKSSCVNPFNPATCTPLPVPGYSVSNVVEALQKTRAEAAFAEGNFDVTDQLSFIAGIRYSSERKQLYNAFEQFYNTSGFNFFPPYARPYTGNFINGTPQLPYSVLPPKTFDSVTPKFGIQYQFDSKTMAYFTYAKGFKSGGFSNSANDASAAIPYDPEKLTDYEAGLKTKLFDNRLLLDFAGYYYDYSNLQVQTVNFVTGSLQTVNAPSARAYGAEAEFTALVTDALTADGSVTWENAKYTNYTGLDNTGTTFGSPTFPFVNYDGKHLNNAPEFTAHLGATYKWNLWRGGLRLRGEMEYSSVYYFDPLNLPSNSQPAYTKGNLFLTYNDRGGWHATAFVRNVSDERTIGGEHYAGSYLGITMNGPYEPPRTYGLQVGYAF
jgi:iron complex outermembrane receptor protein